MYKLKKLHILVFIGVFLVVFLSSAVIAQDQSQSITNQYTKYYILQNAQKVTTQQLYTHKSIPTGQPVKLKGEILQTDSNYVRVKGINISSSYNLDNYDIIVFGNFENIKVYEKDEVWVLWYLLWSLYL